MDFVFPTDERASRWDLANDFGSPAAVKQLVDAVVPPQPNDSNPFFNEAFRDLIVGVVTSLNLSQPGRWDLADVVRILETRDLKDESREQTF